MPTRFSLSPPALGFGFYCSRWYHESVSILGIVVGGVSFIAFPLEVFLCDRDIVKFL